MSTLTTFHHRFTGRGLGAALACAVIVGGAAALGLSLPHDTAGQPVDPAPACVVASCQPDNHALLPGRHDFDIRPDAGRRAGRDAAPPDTSGGRVPSVLL